MTKDEFISYASFIFGCLKPVPDMVYCGSGSGDPVQNLIKDYSNVYCAAKSNEELVNMLVEKLKTVEV